MHTRGLILLARALLCAATLKDALIGCGALTFSHASENIMTSEGGKNFTLTLRQSIQKGEKWLEKLSSEAETIPQACTSISVAINRYNLNPDLKTFLDTKGDFNKDAFCRNADEWLATQPPGTKWYRATSQTDKALGNGSVSKPLVTCFFCGKKGHFASECRARIAAEKASEIIPSQKAAPEKQEAGSQQSPLGQTATRGDLLQLPQERAQESTVP